MEPIFLGSTLGAHGVPYVYIGPTGTHMGPRVPTWLIWAYLGRYGQFVARRFTLHARLARAHRTLPPNCLRKRTPQRTVAPHAASRACHALRLRMRRMLHRTAAQQNTFNARYRYAAPTALHAASHGVNAGVNGLLFK
jgi:hypothetical protein